MDKKARVNELENQLKIAKGLAELYESDAFKMYLEPYLEKISSDIQWIDPKTFKNTEEFIYTYEHMRAKAVVIRTILNYLKEQRATTTMLAKQIKINVDKNGQ